MGREQDLGAWRLLVETVKGGSVNAACERLDMEPSTASRIIKALERDLGFELFQRSSRPVRLTSMGEVAYEQARHLVEAHSRMMAKLTSDRNEMAGMIRVATYGGIAALEVTPLLVKFQQIYADIEFDLVELSAPPPQGFVDGEGNNVDVIMGYGDPNTDIPGVRAWYVGDMPFISCASPAYIRRFGMPHTPQDCLNHIGLTYSSAFRQPAQELVKADKRAPLKWKRTIAFHSVLAMKSALMIGAGISVDMSLYHNWQELKEGTLVPVIDGWSVPTKACFTFAQEDALQTRRIEVFVEWMAQRQREMFARLFQNVKAVGLL